MPNEIKPCPFCGCSAEIVEVTRHIGNNLIVIKCNLCGASTRTFNEKKSRNAIEAWNRRVTDAEEN